MDQSYPESASPSSGPSAGIHHWHCLHFRSIEHFDVYEHVNDGQGQAAAVVAAEDAKATLDAGEVTLID